MASTMKDFLIPVATPFALSNALDIPSGLSPNHYFASSHHSSGARFDVQASDADARDLEGAEPSATVTSSVYGARSAIETIPSELLSLILEAGYFGDESCPHDGEYRSLLSQISRRFREVTLHTPSVWSVVHLSSGNVDEELPCLPVYLSRSKDYPLDIRLSAWWSSETTDTVMDLLLQHSKRWRRLCIIATNPHIFSYLQHAQAPILEDLELVFYSHHRRVSLPSPVFGSHTPRLARLCLRNVNIDDLDISLRELRTLEIRGYGNWPSISRLNELIGGSVFLEKLILHVKPMQTLDQLFDKSDNRNVRVVLPHVRVVEIFTSEWLSSDISALIQVFVCPKLESLVLREGAGPAPSQHTQTVMSYTTTSHLPKDTRLFYTLGEALFDNFPNHLFIYSANLSHARSAFSSSTITSLEIRQVSLPPYDLMKTTFASLVNLKHLFFLGIYPNHALMQMLDNIEAEHFHESSLVEMDSTVLIPSLETLMLDFHHPTWTVLSRDYSAEFMRVFSLPALRSLILKNLKSLQWQYISESFSNSTSRYPKLASLKLIDMTDMDQASFASHSFDAPAAFPNLQRLSLDSIPSNLFVRQILHESLFPDTSDDSSPSLRWPFLEELAISNDPNASKPLLHRVIGTRKAIGRPLKKLCLDEYFYRNADSISWIKEHVEINGPERNFL